MRTKLILLFLAIFTTSLIANAQVKLYMPIEYKRAYEAGTRNWDGTVSDKYFQNRSEYKIKATVDPVTRQVEGSASITYYNNSPESLISFGFHAYKDLYDEGMVIKKLVVDGKQKDINDWNQVRRSATHYGVYIGDRPLETGKSIKIEVDWSITIPAKVDRDGAYDETSMMVAYWYPEMAVYDDVFGWDKIDFDGKAEFYHDVSDYEVEITIPEDFVIWASAAPTNSSDIYPETILKRLNKAAGTSERVSIITTKDLRKGVKMKSNTWKYSVKGFPDFSFAFSDHYLWEACTYTDKHGAYFLNSAYPAKNESFKHVINNEKQVMESFHNDFPVYPFPYKHFVAFNGETGGGMEFPGMCNDQARRDYTAEGVPFSDYDANLLLTQHEMMHMYFPFLMGINEKRYAWMDEGMAEFSEDYYTGLNLESEQSRARFAKSSNAPLMVETYNTPKAYGINSYDISSQSYHALQHLLGKELFIKCMQGYMDRWKNKHPTPYDFFFTFNDISGRDLNWFWKGWYFDWGYPDVALTSYEDEMLTVTNEGGRPIAVEIHITYKDGTAESTMISPIVWMQSSKFETEIYDSEKISTIELKTLNGSDSFRENNFWRSE